MNRPIPTFATIPILILIAPATVVAQAGARPTPTAAPATITSMTAKFSPPCGVESQGIQQNAAAIAASGPMAAAAQPLKQQTRVDVPYLIGVIGQTVPLKAKLTLKPEGGPVPNHTVFFRVDGQFIAAAKTDGQGNAQVPYKVPDVYATRVVEVRYVGSEICAGSKAENSLATTKAPSKITLTSDGSTVRTGSAFYLDGTVTRTTDDKPLDAHAVTLTLDGQPQTAIQTWPGKFRWAYTPQHGAAGNHTVQAQFPGGDLDGAATAAFSLTVLPELIPAELSWDSVDGRLGETKTLTARLRRTDGVHALDALHGIPGVKIHASWGDSKTLGSALTDSAGAARIIFKIEGPPGDYWTTALVDTFDPARGIYDIKRAPGNPTLGIQRGQAKVAVLGPATVKVGGCFDVVVLVTRAADGLPLPSMRVHLTGPYEGFPTTGANGRTPSEPCLKANTVGQAKFDASFAATDLYLADTGSATINVVP